MAQTGDKSPTVTVRTDAARIITRRAADAVWMDDFEGLGA